MRRNVQNWFFWFRIVNPIFFAFVWEIIFFWKIALFLRKHWLKNKTSSVNDINILENFTPHYFWLFWWQLHLGYLYGNTLYCIPYFLHHVNSQLTLWNFPCVSFSIVLCHIERAFAFLLDQSIQTLTKQTNY